MLVYWVPEKFYFSLYYRYVKRSLFEGNKKKTVALASAVDDNDVAS